MSSIKDLPWPLKNRHFIYESSWIGNPDGSFVFAYRPPISEDFSDGVVNFGKNTSRDLIKAEARAIAVIKPAVEHGCDSCEVNFVMHLDGKGKVPPKIVEKATQRSLQFISQAREKFSRDDDIDRIERDKLKALMRNDKNAVRGEVYDESEREFVEKVKERIEKVREAKFMPLNR